MIRLALLATVLAVSLVSCSREGDLDERVKKLESEVERLKEVESFIRPFMEAQQKEAEQEAAREPDPDAVFAVSVEGDHFHGPADAAVTVIEAFDFA